jgi:hypothetical protein
MKSTTTARQTQESPANSSYTVTPADGVEIGDFLPRALYVGTGGNISMQLEGDPSVRLFVGVPSGAILPVKPRIIASTGTTASDILALY